MKYSKNAKTDYVYQDIADYLKELGKDEVKHYMDGFPHEVDYNLVQYGNMRIYYYEIRDLYDRAGYMHIMDTNKNGEYKFSNNELWDAYKRAVGHIARRMVKENLF